MDSIVISKETELNRKVELALERFDRALNENKKKKIEGLRGLYSGGHDSLVACHIASLHPAFNGVIHVNTMTSPSAYLITIYSRSVCEKMGWDLIEVSPFLTFVQILVKYGFPSPSAHPFVYQYLKGRSLQEARTIARNKLVNSTDENNDYYALFPGTKPKNNKKPDIAFVSGIRRLESVARSTTPEFGISESVLWINPIVDWTKEECSEYIYENNLIRNEYADKSGISGECDCGAHAQEGEIDLKCKVNSSMQQYREMLEKMVHLAREIQLFEVETMGRNPSTVIDLSHTIWGSGRKSKHKELELYSHVPLFSICNDCNAVLEGDSLSLDEEIELEFMKLKEKRSG